MNYSITKLLALTSFLYTVTGQEIIVKVIVPEAETLSDDDLASIEQAKESAMNRNLRSRKRRLDPSWCDDVCAGWPYPYCQVWQRECTDHRRRTESVERELPSNSPTFELIEVTGSECDDKKAEILGVLEAAVVTDASRDVVDGSHMSCHTFVEVCAVTSFDLWNADTNSKVRSDMHDGSVICNGDFNFSIEAVADECVESVTFHLQGPNGYDYIHTEQSTPYFMFKDSGGDIKSIFDRHGSNYQGLDNGSYVLTVMPDSDTARQVSIDFELSAC